METSILIVFSICFFIALFFYCICFFYILKKEDKNPYLSYIPIVNACIYLKICKLPIWTLFIPVINIIVLFFSPYCLARQYMLKRKICFLAILFPFIIIPYIAFSKCRNIDKTFNNVFISSSDDIDLLDKQLIRSNSLEFDNESNEIKEKDNTYENSKIDLLMNDNVADNEPFIDEYIYEDETLINVPIDVDQEFIEIDETIIDDLSLNNLDSLEEHIVSSAEVEKNLVTDFQEYDSITPSDEAIAFGGNKKIENFDAVQTKNDTLKCSRCGSNLIGANSICPGCGAQINSI